MQGEFKRETSVSKIVDASPEEEQEIIEVFKNNLYNPDEKKFSKSGELIRDYEREKTDKEIEMMKYIFEKVSEFVRRYGGEPVNLNTEYVHILDNNKIGNDLFEKIGKVGQSFYNPFRQYIGLMDFDNLSNMQNVVHESMHANSFFSVEICQDGNLNFRRGGWETSVKQNYKEIYFWSLNEAITSELEKRFVKEFLMIKPELNDDFEKRKIKAKEILGGNPSEDELEDMLYSYPESKPGLHSMFRDIRDKNPSKFKPGKDGEEEVFNMFARVYFTGNILEVARIFEKTYGKGSFRDFGKRNKQ